MRGVGDVAGDRDDLGHGAELGGGALERAGAAGVDDEAPAVASASARASASPRPREAPVMMAVGMPSKLRRARSGPPSAIGPRTRTRRARAPCGRRSSAACVRSVTPSLAEDVADVGLHRLLRHAELAGDHLVRAARARSGSSTSRSRGVRSSTCGRRAGAGGDRRRRSAGGDRSGRAAPRRRGRRGSRGRAPAARRP